MNLASAFTASAEKNAQKIAIFWGDAEYPYEKLLAQSRWIGRQLQVEYGVRPGDRVAIWLKNCPEFISILWGIWQAGAVAVPINNFLKPYEVTYILSDAGADLLFTEKAMADAFPVLQESRIALKFFLADVIDKPRPATHDLFIPPPRHEQDLAVIIYTSGTTGRPKGALLSHGNLLHNVESCRHVLEAVSFDRFVLLLPMFHSFMLCVCICLPLVVGGSIVLIKSLHPPKAILHEIVARQATLLPAIPQFFRTLASAPVPADLPLRLCVSGAAPLPGEILKEFNARFPIPLIEGYGLSEASPVVSINPIKGPWKAGSVGLPILNVEVTIQSDEGLVLGPGQIGELCVRGGNVMQGYWNRPDETARAMRHGWLLTGDVGYRDEDGYLYITDRKKDMLLVNGINVYPREIEEVIYQFPEIREAAVIGEPDLRKGEQPVAFVAMNDGAGLDVKALQQFIRQKLADYKVPRQVIVLPNLPRNATGKILKTDLRQQHRASASTL